MLLHVQSHPCCWCITMLRIVTRSTVAASLICVRNLASSFLCCFQCFCYNPVWFDKVLHAAADAERGVEGKLKHSRTSKDTLDSKRRTGVTPETTGNSDGELFCRYEVIFVLSSAMQAYCVAIALMASGHQNGCCCLVAAVLSYSAAGACITSVMSAAQ